MTAQVFKCKCLNNTNKQQETIKIYAKGLANMADILLAETNTENTNKHDLVAGLLSHYEQDALGHLTITLNCFIDIYKNANKLSALL
jgi:hypothetical protein